MTKYREILRLSGLGLSQQNIADSCNVSKKTVNRVLKRAKELNISWPLDESDTDAVLAEKFFPSANQVTSNKRMPDYDYIRKELLRNGVSKKLLWTEYMEDCRANGDEPLMYSQFCYHIQQDEQKHRATMHINRKPGEQVEVDWAGDPATITDPDTGEIIKACVIPFNDYVLINDKVYYENDYLLYAMGTNGKSFEYNRDWFIENKQIGLWTQYKRITKDNAAIILFGNGMFTADLMESNKPMWKYNIIWEKTQPTGFLNAKKMPLRNHEDICIFYKKPPTYNPQKTTGHPRKVSKAEHKVGCKSTTDYGEHGLTTYDSTERYPKSVWKFAKDIQKCALHPTQNRWL